MQGTQTTTVYMDDEANMNDVETSDELESFLENVTEGDYIAVVYKTPSNGGSLNRAMGTIKNTRTLHGSFDDCHFDIEECDNEKSGDVGYLHIHGASGRYYFSDNTETDENWGIKKIAWTPEN